MRRKNNFAAFPAKLFLYGKTVFEQKKKSGFEEKFFWEQSN